MIYTTVQKFRERKEKFIKEINTIHQSYVIELNIYTVTKDFTHLWLSLEKVANQQYLSLFVI